ncbi:MAG: VWA domain-containing protein [Chloroflexota bacterium]
MKKTTTTIIFLMIFLAAVGITCQTSASKPPRNAEIIQVSAGTSLQTWLDQAAIEFNAEKFKSEDNKPYYVEITYQEAGQAISQGSGAVFEPDLWIPDNFVWAELAAEIGNPAYIEDCQSVASSPLVIAMWQPIAESLGWPGRDLGWLDIGSLAADPTAWNYYSGGQFGSSLRLGHTHPGLSPSGTSTLLAVVHAAQSKQAAVAVVEIELPIVQASVSAFESAVSTFSQDTGSLSALMNQRGSSYLGAAVVYENLVFEYAGQNPAIIPIYPLEGTFIADFPACVKMDAPENRLQGSRAFRDYLLSEDGQQFASEAGLRTENGSVAEMPFAQPEQPTIVFESPSTDTIYAIQHLWDSARKAVNLVMVIDTSGSMEGNKLVQVKKAAVDFIENMADSDYISIVVYNQTEFSSSHPVITIIEHASLKTTRQSAIDAIRRLDAFGPTPLYDSIGISADIIDKTKSSQTSNALVLLTDGMDTASVMHRFNDQLYTLAMANSTAIYTIAFGNDADEEILSELAIMTNGNFYIGDQSNIGDIYQEMTVIFGGGVGIGR